MRPLLLSAAKRIPAPVAIFTTLVGRYSRGRSGLLIKLCRRFFPLVAGDRSIPMEEARLTV